MKKKKEPKAIDLLDTTQPMRSIRIIKGNKVAFVHGGCEYHKTPTTLERKRQVVVDGTVYNVTSTLLLKPSSTPTEKLLAYLELENQPFPLDFYQRETYNEGTVPACLPENGGKKR